MVVSTQVAAKQEPPNHKSPNAPVKCTEINKTPTPLGISESTARSGMPSYPTPTRISRAGYYGGQRLGLVRSLGLAESHSANFNRGNKFYLIVHTGEAASHMPPRFESIAQPS